MESDERPAELMRHIKKAHDQLLSRALQNFTGEYIREFFSDYTDFIGCPPEETELEDFGSQMIEVIKEHAGEEFSRVCAEKCLNSKLLEIERVRQSLKDDGTPVAAGSQDAVRATTLPPEHQLRAISLAHKDHERRRLVYERQAVEDRNGALQASTAAHKAQVRTAWDDVSRWHADLNTLGEGNGQ